MLSFYEVDWQDVVRQCYDALRRRNEWYAAHGKLAVSTEEPAVRTIYYGDNNPLPQTLLLDRRLTPLERNTWQVLRWLITERQVKTPRYQDLQPYLATSPCGAQASRETIARALNVLRTTRWLSLVERSRDANGCLRGCVYVLHGDPLTAAEQLELDSGYAALLRQNLSHATKGVRDVAKHVIAEIQTDPQVAQLDKDRLGSLPPVQQQTLPLMSEAAASQISNQAQSIPFGILRLALQIPNPAAMRRVWLWFGMPTLAVQYRKTKAKKYGTGAGGVWSSAVARRFTAKPERAAHGLPGDASARAGTATSGDQ